MGSRRSWNDRDVVNEVPGGGEAMGCEAAIGGEDVTG